MITPDQLPSFWATSLNPVVFKFTSDKFEEANMYFRLDVVMTSGANTLTVQLVEYPDANGSATFNLGGIRGVLQLFLEDQELLPVEYPDDGALFNVSTEPRYCSFTVDCIEVYGDPPVAVTADKYEWRDGDPGFCLRGGFSYEHWLPEASWGLGFAEYLQFDSSNVPWLTSKPSVMLIGRDQPERLLHLNTVSYPDAFRQIVVYFTTGSPVTVSDPIDIDANEPLELLVGPKNFGLFTIDPARTVIKYTVQLFGDVGQPITSIRTYIIDYQKYLSERYILFRNSLCGYDCVRLLGEGTLTNEYSRELVELFKPRLNKLRGFNRTAHTEEQSGMQLNTGWISRKEVNWLRDLFLSREAYEVTSDYLIPINITGKKFALPMESDHNAIMIEWQHNFKNYAYSPGKIVVE